MVGLLLLQQQAEKLQAKGVPVPARVQRELEEGLRAFGQPDSWRMPPEDGRQ